MMAQPTHQKEFHEIYNYNLQLRKRKRRSHFLLQTKRSKDRLSVHIGKTAKPRW